MTNHTIPLLLLDSGPETPNLYDSSSAFARYLSQLEARGVVHDQFPDDFRAAGSFNTASGGMRSGGARTSLRNLVVLEGLPFTQAFLKSADEGLSIVGWPNYHSSHFKAQLEWLDLIGDNVANILDDYNQKQWLLDAIDHSFFEGLKFTPEKEEFFLSELPGQLRAEMLEFKARNKATFDQHYARVHVFVVTHANLELVHPDNWEQRLDEVARQIRKTGKVGVLSRLGLRVQ